MNSPLNLTPYFLAILCFMLPFVQVSCRDQTSYSKPGFSITVNKPQKVSGWDSAFGTIKTVTSAKTDSNFSQEPNYLLVGTLASILVAGLATCGRNHKVAALMALTAVGLLITFKIGTLPLSDEEAKQRLENMATTRKSESESSKESLTSSVEDLSESMSELVRLNLKIEVREGFWLCLGCCSTGLLLSLTQLSQGRKRTDGVSPELARE